jgi:hypothetical protein
LSFQADQNPLLADALIQFAHATDDVAQAAAIPATSKKKRCVPSLAPYEGPSLGKALVPLTTKDGSRAPNRPWPLAITGVQLLIPIKLPASQVC